MFKAICNSPNDTLQFFEDACANYHALQIDDRLTDMKIVVNGTRFKVHKLILAAQSRFFETMFYNPSMVESTTDEVELKETDADIFKLLLQITYGGCLQGAERIDPDNLVRLYILLERYQFVKFETSLLHEIANKLLQPNNFWHFLDVSIYYNVISFIDLCFEYFDLCGKQTKISCLSNSIKLVDQSILFSSEDFVKISHNTLKALLDRNLNCSELMLLKATQKWIKFNAKSITNNEKWLLIKRIRLNLIPEYDLLQNVNVTEIDCEDLSEALQLLQSRYDNVIDFYLNKHHNVTKQSFDYVEFVQKARLSIVKNRAYLISNFNICREDFGFRINNYNQKNSLEIDKLEIKKPVEIIIYLGFPFMINYIDMVMSEVKGDKFSYLIEYSVDGFNWSTLFDYRKYLCSNHQTLFFNQIVSRYFRIKGFHQNRIDYRTREAFKVIRSFKAFFKDAHSSIDVLLAEGVLNTPYYALQIKHRVYSNTTMNTFADERYYYQKANKEMDFESESRNRMGFKPIFVLLDQPIMLNTFSFKLYDKDSRAYSFSVNIFDQHKFVWDCVADRSNEPCASWQTIVFSARPVNLIRITGNKIFNSDCQEFRILKFNFSSNASKSQ